VLRAVSFFVGVSAQRERIRSRAAKHRLNEPTWLSLGTVASLHCPPPFHLAKRTDGWPSCSGWRPSR